MGDVNGCLPHCYGQLDVEQVDVGKRNPLSIRIYFYLSYIVDKPKTHIKPGEIVVSLETSNRNTKHRGSVYEPAIGNYQACT